MEHKNVPIATSRPELTAQRIRYSDISRTAGVITTCRKSEEGNIRDQSRSNNSVFTDGQLLFLSVDKIKQPLLIPII
jgi:hypothetical protein